MFGRLACIAPMDILYVHGMVIIGERDALVMIDWNTESLLAKGHCIHTRMLSEVDDTETENVVQPDEFLSAVDISHMLEMGYTQAMINNVRLSHKAQTFAKNVPIQTK